MVESIYGGKTPASDPLSCYEASGFQPRFTSDRRLSIQSTHLKTIAETGGGDESASSSFSVSNVQENVANDGPTVYRRPRTMSLPAIYRDGSYLRMKRPSNSGSVLGRRYSEPGTTLSTYQTLQRISLRSRGGVEGASPYKDPLVESSGTLANLKTSAQHSATPRRHSDPLIYAKGNRLRVSEKKGSTDTKAEHTFDSSKPQLQATRNDSELNSAVTTTRRRKSSLVPVPFKLLQSQQKAQQSQLSKRPLSFPPRKRDNVRQRNLQQSVNMKFPPGKLSNGSDFPDTNNNLEKSRSEDCEGDAKTAWERSDSQTDKYANEDILTQWMKFFG